MWRHKSFSEIQDSDQSISDVDEEHDRNWQENCVSLAGTSDRKRDNLGVASQLELFKGFRQKDLCFSSEDEVEGLEAPEFHRKNLDCKNNFGHSPIISKTDTSTCQTEEWISGVEKGRKMLFKSTTGGRGGNNVSEMLDTYTKGNKKQFQPCASEADTEVRTLDQFRENARRSEFCPIYPKDKNAGSRCKTKRSSSSQIQSLKQGDFWSVWKDKNPNSSDDELLDETESGEHPPVDNTSSAALGDCDGETSKTSLAALQHDQRRHSMAELLDNRKGKIQNLIFKSKKGSRRKGLAQGALVRNVSPSDKDVMSDENPCELMHGGSSTDNEDNTQISEPAIMESERKTMTDKFHEAFGCAPMDNRRTLFTVPKQSGAGLFGRLQHIMQQQKEQDAEFLKKVQSEVWPKDEARCVDVKILSRSFDAKLTVCQCSLLDNEESSLQNPQQENFGKIWTVIFNSRVCGDVDLEVGNLIRIYPPWKEVQVLQGGEIMILTIYFSQIHT